jgi:hypothetical protein
MLKAWISLCHTLCIGYDAASHTTHTSQLYRSGGGVASVMSSGAMDAAAAPKERTEVRYMSFQIAC